MPTPVPDEITPDVARLLIVANPALAPLLQFRAATVPPDLGKSDANEAAGPKTATESKASARVNRFHYSKKGSALSRAVKAVRHN